MTRDLYLYNGLTVISGASDTFIDDFSTTLKASKLNDSVALRTEVEALNDETIDVAFNDCSDEADQYSLSNIIIVLKDTELSDEDILEAKDTIKTFIEEYQNMTFIPYVLLVSDNEGAKNEERCIDVSDLSENYDIHLNLA